jgi:uncharacterized membrane protein
MKRLRVLFLLALGVDAAILAFSVGKLPARVPLHWDVHGDVNRYGSPIELLLFGPATLLFLWGVAEAVRVVDPKMAVPKDTEAENERLATFSAVMGVIAGLMVALHALLVMIALGIVADGRRGHALLIATFSIAFGNIVGRLRPNWLVGIRTPWTLSNDAVWRRTHRTAGRLLVPAGLLSAIGALVLPASTAFTAAVTLLVAPLLAAIALSYVYWRRA